jgi:hypothetical protein
MILPVALPFVDRKIKQTHYSSLFSIKISREDGFISLSQFSRSQGDNKPIPKNKIWMKTIRIWICRKVDLSASVKIWKMLPIGFMLAVLVIVTQRSRTFRDKWEKVYKKEPVCHRSSILWKCEDGIRNAVAEPISGESVISHISWLCIVLIEFWCPSACSWSSNHYTRRGQPQKSSMALWSASDLIICILLSSISWNRWKSAQVWEDRYQ